MYSNLRNGSEINTSNSNSYSVGINIIKKTLDCKRGQKG
jgi:hypothetical protein